MVKNNKGFTMVEIIGAVVIMGVILLLIIPGISKLMAQFRVDYYDKLEGTTNEAGKDFFADNKIYLPDGILETSYVNVSSLISEKYSESLLDYKGENCELSDRKSYTIVVYRGDGKYEYKTCIDCNKEGYTTDKKGTYCDPAWLTGSLGYDYGDTNDIYFYYGTAREKIREDLIRRLNIVKYDNNGNVLDRVVIGDTNEEGILPTNIDIIDNKPILDSSNKKEYLMIYGNDIDNNEEDLKAIIYKHKAPKVTMTTIDGVYTSGSWTNKNVAIKLEKNDNFFALAKRKVKNYQWSINGGAWQDIKCDMTGSDESCTISLTDDYLEANYRFRIVNDEDNISDETNSYSVKIDKILPTITIQVIQDTVIEELTTNSATKETESSIIQSGYVKITVSDRHSGIKETRVCFDGGCTTFTDLEKYFSYSSAGTITATTYDKAGNSSSGSAQIYYEQIDNTTSYCTITFDARGGFGNTGSKDVECGTSVTLPYVTKSGYDFEGWYDEYSDYIGGIGSDYVVNYTQTVYANWNEIEEIEYTITYNGNYGTVSPSSDTVASGESVILPRPNRGGYIFIGWYTNATGGSLIGNAGDSYEVYYTQTVHAHWVKEEEEIQMCTITYDANGGSVSPTSQTVACGTQVTLPTPTRSGYTFTGWYTASSGGNSVGSAGSTYKVNSDITVYAQWNKNSVEVSNCTITYNANGGSVSPTSETVACGTQVTLPTPTRSGYTFTGWYTASSGGNSVGSAGSTYKVSSDITVYAHWEQQKQTYTIKYDGNGDTCASNCPSSTTCYVDEDCTLASNNYKAANYHATYGWNTSSDGKGTTYSGGQTVKNLAPAGGSITLYSYYKCDYSGRTASHQSTSTFNVSRWPWNMATWDGTTVLSYNSDFGCSTYRRENGLSKEGAQTCFSSSHVSAGYWAAYGVTCQYCGRNSSSIWCPVHDSGSEWRQVCDANSSTFTGANCRK